MCRAVPHKQQFTGVPELAGVPVGEMIEFLDEFGVKSNLGKEDFLKGLANLQKVW